MNRGEYLERLINLMDWLAEETLGMTDEEISEDVTEEEIAETKRKFEEIHNEAKENTR